MSMVEEQEPNQVIDRKGHDALWGWFGLGHSSWLTIPRILLHAMPDEWQGKMAALLTEYDDAFPNQPNLGTRVQVTKFNVLTATPEWLINYRRPDQKMISLMKSDRLGKGDVSTIGAAVKKG